MVIDTSAILAVLLNEATAARIAQLIETSSPRLLSAANLLETSIVIESRKGEPGGRELDLLLYRAGIDIVPLDQDQAEIARVAWRRVGKGRHPAALNYGRLLCLCSREITATAVALPRRRFLANGHREPAIVIGDTSPPRRHYLAGFSYAATTLLGVIGVSLTSAPLAGYGDFQVAGNASRPRRSCFYVCPLRSWRHFSPKLEA